MHADEVDTDASLVRGLLAAQYPRWADLPIERIPSGGTEFAVYRVGDDLAVRLPLHLPAVPIVHHEHEWLPRLAPLLPLAIPEPLAKGRPALGYAWPWSVYRWLPGANPADGTIRDLRQAALDLARFVNALHAIDLPRAPRAYRGVTLASRDASVRRALDVLAGEIDTVAAADAWDAALRVPAWDAPPVWIHGDISSGNLLCVCGRLSAVIDFSGVGLGEPAPDLIVAWELLPPEERAVFRRAVRVDDATWARGRGWALSTALIALPYYRETNEEMMRMAGRKLAAVLAEQAA